jgi:hypothetical protein
MSGEAAAEPSRRPRPRRRRARQKAQPRAAPRVWGLLAGLAALLVGGGMAVVLVHVRATGRHLREGPSAAAPRNPGGGSPPGPARPPAVPTVPPGWQEIRSPEGRFTVAMPAGAFERRRTMSSRVGPVRDKAYLRELQGGFSTTWLPTPILPRTS